LRRKVREAAPDPVAPLLEAIGMNEGGVWKRIDENRELFALLQREGTTFLEAHPWVERWLQSNEDYLSALADKVPVEQCYLKPWEAPDSVFPRRSILAAPGR
jgi:hypothetical protein